MSSSNPLTDLRLLVATALREYPPLLEALGPNALNLIQVWDRPEDVRGDMAESEAADKRMQMRPAACEWNLTHTNDALQFRRRYAIEIFSRDVRVEFAEQLEWLVMRGLARLFKRLKPADGTTAITDPSPLVLHSIHALAADPEREPLGLDPENWTNVCDVEATGYVLLADMIAA